MKKTKVANTSTDTAKQQNAAELKFHLRQNFISVLKYLLRLPDAELAALTYEDENIVDVVSEDSKGIIDKEVYEIVMDEITKRGISFDDKSNVFSDDDLMTEDDSVDTPVEVENVPLKEVKRSITMKKNPGEFSTNTKADADISRKEKLDNKELNCTLILCILF